MKVNVLEDALADMAEGFSFYEHQVEGLGEYFLDSLWSDIQSLQLFGGMHQLYYGYYRLVSKRFPFAIYYRVNNETVFVYAVLDCRRDSDIVVARLKG